MNEYETKPLLTHKIGFPCVYYHAHILPNVPWSFTLREKVTAQKMKFCIKDFFSKFDQTCSFLRIWSYLLKKSLMENFSFCAVRVLLLLPLGKISSMVCNFCLKFDPYLKEFSNEHFGRLKFKSEVFVV